MTSNGWNFAFSLFFFVVLGAVVWQVGAEGPFPAAVPPFDAMLMAFAAFRITRLIVYDKIALWFRSAFAGAPEGTFADTVDDLLHCPWCVGFWGALVVAFCYFTFPWAWFVIFFLALAGAGSLLQVIANAVGWHAENLKMEAKERQRDLRL
jgi:hypothetical protein